MKIAHLSDLHFASCDWSPTHFFSKRWLGNLNFLFGRRGHFDHQRLNTLPKLLKSLDVTTVLITGDLSTTSAPAEFAQAKRFIESLREKDLEVFCIPGNHDHYTRNAYRNRLFYDYFESHWDQTIPYSLKSDGVSAKKIADNWWIVGLDTALATSWVHSTGYFHPRIEHALSEILKQIPTEDQILLMNHFPFFQHESPRKRLIRGKDLEHVIEKHPQIKIYCHGHTHRRCKANLAASGLPLILDTGSTPHVQGGGWYLIDLPTLSAIFYEWKKDEWKPNALV